MLNSTTIEDQYIHAAEDDLRVLIVGAGIAGVTAAQLLRRDGRHPVLLERARDAVHPGYMLALMPMVDQAFEDLGVREQYRDNSVPFGRYAVRSHTGRLLREDSMAGILDEYGDYRGISRGELIDVLTPDACDVTFDTTVTALTDSASGVVATLAVGGQTRELEFDLVIVADGIHSTTRALALGDQPVEVVDTKWGGWVVWAPEDADSDLGEELWGAGFFLGTYPVKGSVGVFLGGPSADTRAGTAPFIDRVRRSLKESSPRIESALRAVTDDPDPYYWPLTDCRSSRWALGRTVLLGDAAAGFLPTAGIGAGMAMESAWVLTRMLRGAGPAAIPPVLAAYEQAQRPRVESAQGNSRALAGAMFHRSRILAVLRDLAMRMVSVKFALKSIQKLLANQPNPHAAVAEALQASAAVGKNRSFDNT